VTFTFARMSRRDVALERELAFGAVAANAVMYLRVLLAVTVLNAALVPRLISYLAGPALIAAAIAAWGVRRASPSTAADPSSANPLQLGAALQMVVLFQAVLVAVYLASRTWSESGVLTSAAVLGLTDVDALTMSMARHVAQEASLDIAALGIAVGVVANSILKTVLAAGFGGSRFRVIAGGGLATVALVSLAALAMLWP
jgi:uncharacterized membrane protein (DUF4010 family)